MKQRLWKKIAAACLTGCVLLSAGTVLAMTEADEVRAYQEEAVQGHNTAVPLTGGSTATKYRFGRNGLSMSAGYEYLLVRDEAFQKARPEFCQSLINFCHRERQLVMDTIKKHEEMAVALGPDEKPQFEVKSSIGVRRADARAVSLLSSFYEYAGGVHGMYGVQGASFDTATGQKIELEDICLDMPRFIGLLEEQLRREYPEDTFFSLEDYFARVRQENGSKLNWTLEADGIAVWFNPYEIAAYASGVLMVKIPFFSNSGLFNFYYSVMPYGSGIPVRMPVDFGWRTDGSHKRLEFFHKRDKEGKHSPLIVLSGHSFEDEGFCGDELKPVYFHLEGVGADYLYVFLKNGGYYQLNVYDLGGETAAKLAELPGMRPAVYKDEFDFYELGTKPDKLVLEKENSGSWERGVYTVGGDGLPRLVK